MNPEIPPGNNDIETKQSQSVTPSGVGQPQTVKQQKKQQTISNVGVRQPQTFKQQQKKQQTNSNVMSSAYQYNLIPYIIFIAIVIFMFIILPILFLNCKPVSVSITSITSDTINFKTDDQKTHSMRKRNNMQNWVVGSKHTFYKNHFNMFFEKRPFNVAWVFLMYFGLFVLYIFGKALFK